MSAEAFLHGLADRPEWIDDALCAETDPDSFFPEKGGTTRDAKAMCRRCDVQDECLAYALEHQERFGIWGGLSERERRKLRPVQEVPPPDAMQSMILELWQVGLSREVIAERIRMSVRTVERVVARFGVKRAAA